MEYFYGQRNTSNKDRNLSVKGKEAYQISWMELILQFFLSLFVSQKNEKAKTQIMCYLFRPNQ